MPNPAMMKFFEYAHLPEKLQTVSKPIGEVAKQMEEALNDSAEKTAGLRKLLEAKDCFVRAALPVVVVISCLFGCMAHVSAAEPTYGGYTYDQLGSYAGSATKEEHEASVRAHERAEAVQDAQRRANGTPGPREVEYQNWRARTGKTSDDPIGEAYEAQKARAKTSEGPRIPEYRPVPGYTDLEFGDIARWKAAYDREQARKAKKAGKSNHGKSAAISSHFPMTLALGLIGNAVNYVPAEAAILFPRLRVLQLIWNTNGNGSACANGQCGAPAAVKPMPLPNGTAANTAKPLSLNPNDVFDPRTPEQKRIWLERDLRDGGASARRDLHYWESQEPRTLLIEAFIMKDRARVDAVEKAKAANPSATNPVKPMAPKPTIVK